MNNRNISYSLPSIDLNCDLAQAIGVFRHCPNEEALLPFVTSVNIACGGHAGDPSSIAEALRFAKERGLAVGAHIGYPDVENFGRKEIPMSTEEMQSRFSMQLGVLMGMADSVGLRITHVRPHAALAAKCSSDFIFAQKLANVIISIDPWLAFVGPAGIYLNALHEATGILTIGEVSLDRTYRRDGVKKQYANPKQQSLEFALSQAHSLLSQSRLIVENNKRERVSFRTIHLDMDKPYSLTLAREVHQMLIVENRLSPFHPFHKATNIQSRELLERIDRGFQYMEE